MKTINSKDSVNIKDTILIATDTAKIDTETVIVIKKEESIFNFVSNDALFTTITTILVFGLGLLATMLRNYLKSIKKRKSIRKFIKHHLDSIVDSYCDKLLESYSKIVEDTTIDSGITLTPPKILSNDFQRLLSIDPKELYESIPDMTTLSKMMSHIDFINNLLPEVQMYHKDARKKSEQYRTKINDLLNQYMTAMVEFVENTDRNSDSYNIIDDYIKLFYAEISGTRNLKRFYDEILRPCQFYLVKEKLYRTDPFAKSIAALGREFTLKYNELEVLVVEFGSQYAEFHKMIKESKEKLNENRNLINWR